VIYSNSKLPTCQEAAFNNSNENKSEKNADNFSSEDD